MKQQKDTPKSQTAARAAQQFQSALATLRIMTARAEALSKYRPPMHDVANVTPRKETKTERTGKA